jgi:hypothetical protein
MRVCPCVAAEVAAARGLPKAWRSARPVRRLYRNRQVDRRLAAAQLPSISVKETCVLVIIVGLPNDAQHLLHGRKDAHA